MHAFRRLEFLYRETEWLGAMTALNNKDFKVFLHEDYVIRKHVKAKLYASGVSKIEIERTAQRVTLNIFTAKPGIVIGRGGQDVEVLKKELEKAEHFIFMEYFIVQNGSAFRELEEILVRKAREGVEIRLLYDDFGSIANVGREFSRRLAGEGIQCIAFNPASPFLNLFLNHRDHRKITVIDGKVGFTGGYNLADEYFDIVQPYGKWKDSAIKLEGE